MLSQLCSLELNELSMYDDIVNNYEMLSACGTLRKFSTGYTETPSNYMGFPLSDCNPVRTNRYSTNFQFPILPHITKLDICRELSEAIMPHIHLYHSLKNLSIGSLNGQFIANSTITRLTNLRKLKIHCYAKDDDLQLFDMTDMCLAKSLRELDLRYNLDLTCGVFRYLTNFENLIFLNVCGTKIKKNNIEEYRKLFANPLLDIYV